MIPVEIPIENDYFLDQISVSVLFEVRRYLVITIQNVSFKGIIFDLDGTLYPRKGIMGTMIRKDLRHVFWLNATQKARKDLRGKDLKTPTEFYLAYFSAIAKSINKPTEVIQSWYFDFYYPNFIQALEESFHYQDGLITVLDYFHQQHIRMCILSDFAFVQERVTALKIPIHYFSGFFSSEEMGALKPSPRCFYEAATSLGLQPSDIAVIGDRSDTDEEGAVASGMSFIGIAENEAKVPQSSSHPWYLWDQFHQMVVELKENE